LLLAIAIIADCGTLKNVLGESESVDIGVNIAEDFADFFHDKDQSVRACITTTPSNNVQFRSMPMLECWLPVTTKEVEKLISLASCKTTQLDPAPMWLIKDMKLLLTPLIVLLFNKSLVSGCYLTTSKIQ